MPICVGPYILVATLIETNHYALAGSSETKVVLLIVLRVQNMSPA